MQVEQILLLYIAFRLVQQVVERILAFNNKKYYSTISRQKHAQQVLGISDEEMQRTLNYSLDKYKFSNISSWISVSVTLVFLALGGLGWFEHLASNLVSYFDFGEIVQGLLIFALLGLASMLLGLPFDLYLTFRIEEKHGFNRQTVSGFFVDRLKGLIIGGLLGGLLLAAILAIMGRMGSWWWIYAWVAVSGFSLLTVWLYPTFLAPLFNKFSPLTEGSLKEKIDDLSKKIGFAQNGIFIMDASKRSSHGNAYFTGVGNKKRIVLFDTLVESMSDDEVVAVLAHELGHFKLKHVRSAVIRSIFITGVIFFLISVCMPLEVFYRAFALDGVSAYGALIVFSLWFGLLDFFIQPFTNFISRKNEFAADEFAKLHLGESQTLGKALLKLREKSQVMPLSHPYFSGVYHSHPPLLERLEALGFVQTFLHRYFK